MGILLVQISRLGMPPAAQSFLSQEKRLGRKECLDAFGAFCGCGSGGNLIFSRCEHTKSLYGRYGTRRLLRYTEFDSSCL